MRHVGVCQDVRYLIISMQFIEENRKNVVFEEMSVREKFMKRCPRCNRVYSDLVSVCPECNVSLTSKVMIRIRTIKQRGVKEKRGTRINAMEKRSCLTSF